MFEVLEMKLDASLLLGCLTNNFGVVMRKEVRKSLKGDFELGKYRTPT
jgi:hypothetical protein